MEIFRKVHRTFAPVMGILIGVYCVTSLVYRIARDFYGLGNEETHFFLDIHDGMIYGSVGVSLAYIVFSWVVIGTQVVTGISMVEHIWGYKIRPQHKLAHKTKPDWSRRIHHTVAPLGAFFFLYKMLTAGTYHLLTEGFNVPVSRVHFLLDMHDARIPGVPWFPTLWVFLVGSVAVAMVASGMTILKRNPKVAENLKVDRETLVKGG